MYYVTYKSLAGILSGLQEDHLAALIAQIVHKKLHLPGA